MKFLMLGDIVGKVGRKIVAEYTPVIKEKLGVDFVVANADNVTHGDGINSKHAKLLLDAGVDVLTTGDHIGNDESLFTLAKETGQILFCANYNAISQKEECLLVKVAGKKVLLVNILGVAFMNEKRGKILSPYRAMDAILEKYKLGENVDAIFVDLHAEATSEKICFAKKYDGMVTAVYGTHTHIPTNDARLLPKGTGFITDIGMCGIYDSALGRKIENAIYVMKQTYGEAFDRTRLSVEERGISELTGVIFELDDESMKVKYITPFNPFQFKKHQNPAESEKIIEITEEVFNKGSAK